MDQLIVAQKIESLRRCLQRVEAKVPAKVELLAQDADLQDILVLNLTRAVQMCVDIGSHIISDTNEQAPSTMGDVFEALNKLDIIKPTTCESMRKAVGFRNIAVHNYDVINWDIVFAICTKSLPDFREFVREVMAYSEN